MNVDPQPHKILEMVFSRSPIWKKMFIMFILIYHLKSSKLIRVLVRFIMRCRSSLSSFSVGHQPAWIIAVKCYIIVNKRDCWIMTLMLAAVMPITLPAVLTYADFLNSNISSSKNNGSFMDVYISFKMCIFYS